MGSILLPEQDTKYTTSHGFILTIDPFQNAIRTIEHPTISWKKHEEEILREVRKDFPGIQIWRDWAVTYSSSKGAEECIRHVRACKRDLPEMFPTFIKAEEEIA